MAAGPACAGPLRRFLLAFSVPFLIFAEVEPDQAIITGVGSGGATAEVTGEVEIPEDDAELLRVSLLQGTLSIRRSTHLAAAVHASEKSTDLSSAVAVVGPVVSSSTALVVDAVALGSIPVSPALAEGRAFMSSSDAALAVTGDAEQPLAAVAVSQTVFDSDAAERGMAQNTVGDGSVPKGRRIGADMAVASPAVVAISADGDAPSADWRVGAGMLGDLPATGEGTTDDTTVFFQSELTVHKREVDSVTVAGSALESEVSAGRVLRSSELGRECLVSLNTLSLHTLLEVIRAAGIYPVRPPCTPQEVAQASGGWLPGISSKAAELLQAPVAALAAEKHPDPFAPPTDSLAWANERALLMAYLGFYLGSLVSVWYWLNNPSKVGDKPIEYLGHRRMKTDIDVEEATWRRSWLSWMCCSWASNWVARWGHAGDPSHTKIKPDDLPQMGGKEQQAHECAKLFQQLWADEVQQEGLEKASVYSVIVKMWGITTMIWLIIVLGLQQMITNLYTVILIEHAMNYFIWLQQMRYAHPEYQVSLTVPILCVIIIFSSVPFLNCLLSSIAHNIARRLDQRVSGALCVAVFQKAQRLPASFLQSQESQKKDGDGEQSGSQPVDMMQLIGYDIMGNLQGAYFQVCMLCTCFSACVIFTVLLWLRLKHATFVALAVSIFVLILMVTICGKMAESYGSMSTAADQRVQAVREVLQGIRIVKCYAWEEAMEAKILRMRDVELNHLGWFFHRLGLLNAVAMMFPRALVISALAAYCVMYGMHSVSNIMVCMQILYFLKASCEGVAIAMGRAVMIQPSLLRIEQFLKMPEAPLLLPDRVPDWVVLWKGIDTSGDTKIGSCIAAAPRLTVRGSFRWRQDGPRALHDLDFDIAQGELVGIVGRVGSGKSTLLQAVLGELFPDTTSGAVHLSRPEVIAYCAQVPHIAEGTLKSNILFGQDFDQARYDQVVEAASLMADLKVLPGGDLVPIGSRGITLSGGQKARVSMARAAYHQGSSVVLLDDPFGSVDASTAKVLLEELLLGPLMVGRTRVVVLQPDADRIKRFDRVVLLEDGRIREQGTPSEVTQTEAWKAILSSQSSREMDEDNRSPTDKPQTNTIERMRQESRSDTMKLREDESDTRPTWHMVDTYAKVGLWRNFTSGAILFFVQVAMYMFSDLVLANWTNAIASHPQDVDQHRYIMTYLFWFGLGSAFFPIAWAAGQEFTLRISRDILGLMLRRILNAPIDRFFDKHPLGRVMNRMVSDIAAVDLQLYNKIMGTIALLYLTTIPLFYVHFIVPWFVSALALPLYYIVATLARRYWHTTVPLKYCAANARSEVNNLVGDVTHSNAVIRAYGEQERVMLSMCDAVDDELKAVLYGERVLRRWLLTRVRCLWSFFTSSMYIVGLMSTDQIGAGTLGLCLSMLLVIDALIEPNLDQATGAQLEFISLARIHEYMSIAQEEPRWMNHDARYRNFSVRVRRRDVGLLMLRGEGAGVEIFRCRVGPCGNPSEVILRATECRRFLHPGRQGFANLADVCPTCPELLDSTDWHRIAAVNDAVADVDSMSKELCEGESEFVLIEVQSGWLSEGAKVEIEGLRVGYADMQRDVLKNVTVTFEAKTKVGIVGTTGCGKSSMLWALLRILEPRAGRILLDGVDTRDVGLGTLRRALGLVPQDPVLFSGTLRQNLDPQGNYPDGRLLHALQLAQLGELLASWAEGLDKAITDEGGGLSFGQRQLVCLARMVLRRPRLLLLDEATSAIDPRTQEIVHNTIREAFADSTVIAVAHRLETILDYDFVCVLDRGDVVEKGPVAEVAQKQGGHLNRMLAVRGLA